MSVTWRRLVSLRGEGWMSDNEDLLLDLVPEESIQLTLSKSALFGSFIKGATKTFLMTGDPNMRFTSLWYL